MTKTTDFLNSMCSNPIQKEIMNIVDDPELDEMDKLTVLVKKLKETE